MFVPGPVIPKESPTTSGGNHLAPDIIEVHPSSSDTTTTTTTTATTTAAAAIPPPIITLPGGPQQITVRRFRFTDAPHLARHLNSHMHWLNVRDRFPYPYTEQSALDFIHFSLDEAQSWEPCGPGVGTGADTFWAGPKVPSNYVITLDDVVVGGIGLEFGTDIERRSAELGYWVAEEFMGRGIATKAATAFVQWAFATFDRIVRLRALVFAWNLASMRVLEKVGFVQEGTKKCAAWKAGRLVDLVEFAKVREGCVGESALPEEEERLILGPRTRP